MRSIWRFIASIELTIVLAVLICVDAAVGSFYTVKFPEFYRSLDQLILFPALFGSGKENLSFTYWIYILIVLVALFSINTTACTADRLYQIVINRAPWYSICPHIVHIGFLIAVLGHLAGSVYGFKSQFNLLVADREMPIEVVPGLSVRLDGVDIERGPDGRSLESLKTSVTLFEEGNVVHSGDIEINGPLIYKGMAFYHMREGVTATGLLLDIDGDRKAVELGTRFTSKDGTSFRLGRIFPDFALDGQGRPTSRSDRYRNPYQEIVLEGSRGGEAAYLSLTTTAGGVTLGGKRIRLVDNIYSRFAVISIVKDAGIWIIIVGSSVLVLGMVLVFIFRRKRAELVRV